MKTNLAKISKIQTGYFAKPIPDGEAYYLQAKNFNDSGEIMTPIFPDLEVNRQTEKHFLRVGDVLFAAKGSKNFAANFNSEDIKAVASTTFFVIKVQSDEILPEYLVWFLNNPETLAKLKKGANVSSMVSIPKIALENLEITIPPLEKQKCILAISGLVKRERKIRERITELRETLIQQEIINAIK